MARKPVKRGGAKGGRFRLPVVPKSPAPANRRTAWMQALSEGKRAAVPVTLPALPWDKAGR